MNSITSLASQLQTLFLSLFRRLPRRPHVSLAFLFLSLLLLYLILSKQSPEERFFAENYLKFNHHDVSSTTKGGPVCNLPLAISPFDRTIRDYLKNYSKSVVCPGGSSFHPLTYIDEESGFLRQNDSSSMCQYQWIGKVRDDDDAIEASSWAELHPIEGLPLRKLENYLQVTCNEGSYENVHFWFNLKEGLHSAPPITTHKKPSVIILVIESLSRLNYLRYLKQTRSFLEDHLGNTFYLDGLNKMADNSLPNMLPLLSGRRLHRGELGGVDEKDGGPYDTWPLIWKNFSAAGYLTALVEDYPKLTLFNYNSLGFVAGQPTDLYPRPWWLQVFRQWSAFTQRLYTFTLSPCYRDRVPKVDLFLNQVGSMAEKAAQAERPLFAFAFYIEMTHNDFNKAQTIDSHIAAFLGKYSSALNDSIFILMGDHGNRFGDVLQTTVGRIEERMPLFAVHLPAQLTERFPSLATNLRANRRRLSTWLDVNQILQDILHETYSNMGKPAEPKRAYSPWREVIPLDRSCQDALIDDLYCACDRRHTLNHQTDLQARAASVALVEHLNARLSGNVLCQQLSLRRILRAEFIFPSSSTAQVTGFHQVIEITLKVTPSGGIFRSRLFRTAFQLKWTVEEGQVTRLNEYGDQPWCINQRSLKPFCFCAKRGENRSKKT